MKHKYLLGALLCAAIAFAHAENNPLDEVVVTATRFKEPVATKPINMTVITQADIQQSSARTVPELLSMQAGISMRDFFGNNAASSTVDMRGFGAAAGQNTLVLLDGRRISDPDMSGVQWSAIPFAAIERIEILRGSGAVMYGDGATGGVINIITRTALRQGASGELAMRVGSYGAAEAQVSGGYVAEGARANLTASKLKSDGYRANNRNDQSNVQADLRWMNEVGELSLKLGIDQQAIRLPGARTVQASLGTDQVASDPRGATTPLDYASRDGSQIGVEWQQTIADADINVGVSHRTKNQKSYYDFNGYPSYRDSDLQVDSFTPRVRMLHGIGGESSMVVGVDLHRWDYALRTSNAASNIGQPINRVGMSQNNDAVYFQNTTQLLQSTTLLMGLRNERVSMRGADIYNGVAPGASFGSAAPAGSFSASKNAYELGLRHELGAGIALNGKIGRSFRFANVDEIYESDSTYSNQFQFLRPQTSDGVEFGLAQKVQAGIWRVAVFSNKVTDEIHLDPFTSGVGNTNLPLSQRRGVEFVGKWQMSPQLILNSALTYTDARILSGTWSGKHVPLVPNQKANMAASWSFSDRTRLNVAWTYVSSQYMENDEANTLGVKIPAYALTDLKLVHQMGALQLNASVNNLFDRKYYNYAVSSQFTAGKYNAYTLPGRTLFLGLNYAL